MKRSKAEKGEKMSWMTKLFERLFVTKERTNKTLKRSFSFRSRQHQTKNNDQHKNLIDVNRILLLTIMRMEIMRKLKE